MMAAENCAAVEGGGETAALSFRRMPNPIMSAENIPPLLVDELTLLCRQCPKGCYTEHCPFGKFAGVSEASRRWMFEQMKPGQVEQLFALATDCVCPKDPREPGHTGT